MQLAVIIVNYNVEILLTRCLKSLMAAMAAAPSLTIEIVVIDNASTDGSVEMLKTNFPSVKVLALQENVGFSRAVNLGVKHSSGELLLLLNPDTALPEDAFTRMLEEMSKYASSAPVDVLAMGFRQVDEEQRLQLSLGWWPTLPQEAFRHVLQLILDNRLGVTLGRVVNRLLDAYLKQKVRQVPWVAGSCILVSRAAFIKIGGFDEQFFLFFEDWDFCLRLWQIGGVVYYNPQVTLLHHRGASSESNPESKALASKAYRTSQLYFWHKYRGKWLGKCFYHYLSWRKKL